MEPLKNTVVSVMLGLQEKKIGVAGKDPADLLKKALTKKELQHINFNYFRKGILGLTVDSSAWLYNFNLQKQDLIARLNKQFGSVKELRLRIGNTK
jgi:hypothetical protein